MWRGFWKKTEAPRRRQGSPDRNGASSFRGPEKRRDGSGNLQREEHLARPARVHVVLVLQRARLEALAAHAHHRGVRVDDDHVGLGLQGLQRELVVPLHAGVLHAVCSQRNSARRQQAKAVLTALAWHSQHGPFPGPKGFPATGAEQLLAMGVVETHNILPVGESAAEILLCICKRFAT